MKYLKWFAFILIFVSCSRGDVVKIRGKINQGERVMIYLDEQGLTEFRSRDSTKLKTNGSFMLKDRISVPTFYNLHLGSNAVVPLLLKPGDQVVVNTSRSSFGRPYTIEGSQESLDLQDLNRNMAKTRRILDSLSAAYEANLGNEQVQAEIQEKYSEVYDQQRKYNIQFVLDHMTSMSAIYALYQKFDEDNLLLNTYRDVQLLKITAQALDTIYPESEYVQSLHRDAENLESDIMGRNLKQFLDAMPSSHPEIALPDPYGDTIALSSLDGKVVLLSFWASWNPASVGLNREFKKLYDRYHSRGFNIYSVSFDSELEPWMKNINFEELPWTHVSELSYPESSVAVLYNVTELPTFFLMDRNGNIQGKNYDMMALDRKISELILKN